MEVLSGLVNATKPSGTFMNIAVSFMDVIDIIPPTCVPMLLRLRPLLPLPAAPAAGSSVAANPR
jgi:hypothetical protein